MRRLSLLALVALVAFPLSAHDHWRGSRPVLVVAGPRCAPHGWVERRWEHERWDRRGDDHRYVHGYGCEEGRIILGPPLLPRLLAPPFLGRVELRLR
jgi:hypothetical protein